MLIVTSPGSWPNVFVPVDQRDPLLRLIVLMPAVGLAAPPPPEITATPVAFIEPLLKFIVATLVAVDAAKKPAVPVPTTPVETAAPLLTSSVARAPNPPASTTLLGAAPALAAAVFTREFAPSTRR